jgi:hypothetical protein
LEIDTQSDIYASIATAEAVVGELSTGLYEAVGIARRVFLWATPKARFCYPEHPFTEVSNVEDLAIKMTDPEAGLVRSDIAAALWEPNWRSNYVAFLKTNGVQQIKDARGVSPRPQSA